VFRELGDGSEAGTHSIEFHKTQESSAKCGQAYFQEGNIPLALLSRLG
jgi:hypothetical protein